MRRRIRAGELLLLAGDIRRSLEHLKPLDIDRLTTTDLEKTLPLLLDLTDLVHGAAAATAIITRAVGAGGGTGPTGPDPRRRALVLALASDVIYGIRGGKRDAALSAISYAEAAGASADATLHRALLNLFMAKAIAAEGLDTSLLDRAARLEASLPSTRLYDSADQYRGWSRYVEDLDTARAALRRCVSWAKEIGDDFALVTFLSYLAMTEVLAGDYTAAAGAMIAADAASVWYDWPPSGWHLEPRCEVLIAAGDLDGAARSSGGARPASSPATHCAGRTNWSPIWATGRCSPKSSGSCPGWRPHGPAPS